MRRFLILFPALLSVLVFGAMALPMGDFVELHTVDSEGREFSSSVWVAEVDGALHLRSGWPESHWLERLSTHPLVEIEHDGDSHYYRAVVVDDPAVRTALNEALAAKYSVADRLIGRFVDMDASIPVRLEPIEGLDDAHDH